MRHGDLKTYIEANQEEFDNPQIFKAIKDLVNATDHKITAQRAHQIVMAERIVATMGDDVDQSRRRARNLSRPSGANSTKVQVPTNLKHGAEVGEWLDNTIWCAAGAPNRDGRAHRRHHG